MRRRGEHDPGSERGATYRGNRSRDRVGTCAFPRTDTTKAVSARRVDLTMWLDSERDAEVHVHEDGAGDGPAFALWALPPEQRERLVARLVAAVEALG